MDGFELSGSGGGEPFGGYSYLGSLYLASPADLLPLAEKLHESISSLPGVLASASVPSQNFCVVRALTQNATVLYRILNGCRTATRAFLRFPAPPRQMW